MKFLRLAALIEIADQLQISVDYLLGRSELQESNITPETSRGVSGSLSIDARLRDQNFLKRSANHLRRCKNLFLSILNKDSCKKQQS
jgi:hypothetical protein